MRRMVDEIPNSGIEILDYGADPIVALVDDRSNIEFPISLDYVSYVNKVGKTVFQSTRHNCK